MNHKLHICLILCCLMSGSPAFQLFSRNLRQQGHHYLEHQKTYNALSVDDVRRCGGLIGCGLVNIEHSGKRKRNSDYMDRFLLKREDNLPYAGNGWKPRLSENQPRDLDISHIQNSDRLPHILTDYQRKILGKVLMRLSGRKN